MGAIVWFAPFLPSFCHNSLEQPWFTKPYKSHTLVQIYRPIVTIEYWLSLQQMS